jgi:hypothetical protein
VTQDQENVPTKPKLAKEIRVERGRRLVVDGEEFPWFLTEDGVSTEVKQGKPPTVTITLLAETVFIEDSLD